MRRRLLQPIRRTVLAVTLASIFVLPIAQVAGSAPRGRGLVDLAAVPVGPVARAAVSVLGPFGTVFAGSVWSVGIAGFEVADPLAASMVAVAGRSSALVLAALAPVVVTALLGRVFCGWVCPARLPVELAAWIRRRTRTRLAIKAPWLRWAKYGVLGAGLVLAAATGWNLLVLIYPPAILTREAHYVLAYGALGWGAVVVSVAFVADLVVERGAWCRGLCPGGALYSLLGLAAPLRIDVDEGRCTACGRCVERCPLGLDPSAGATAECDRCGLCQAACASDALTYTIALGRRKGDGPGKA